MPPVATEIVAVRDLDLVDDDRWPQALALLAQPPLRDALDPAGTDPAAGRHARDRAPVHRLVAARTTRSSTAAARRACARPAATRCCAGLYDEADATGFDDEQVLRALGVRTSVAALLDEPGGAAELLDRLADPDLPGGRRATARACTGRWPTSTPNRSPCRTSCARWWTAR